ncbi:MAG: DedA family protein, partial [Deltaproteobacteria bacterium]|nr:DedA family protein [Deltaproteobacteria bacterium]
METIITWIVDIIARLGYPGIVILMFLESSFFPFPSEIVIPPAGYLASQGSMNIWLVILTGILGSLLGALFNYYLALWLGRPLLTKFGKYFFLTPERFAKVDDFFLKHGDISTFTGRLITVVRQYISFPAGLTRMNILKFSLYTAIGAGIWVTILACIGFMVGNNIELVQQYSKQASLILLVFIVILVLFYIIIFKRNTT